MITLTNAQVAILAASQQEGLSTYSVTDRADRFLEWLDKNS